MSIYHYIWYIFIFYIYLFFTFVIYFRGNIFLAVLRPTKEIADTIRDRLKGAVSSDFPPALNPWRIGEFLLAKSTFSRKS